MFDRKPQTVQRPQSFYNVLDAKKREIRLALLEARFTTVGSDKRVPSLSLSHVSTNQQWPRYCALSYTWGSPTDVLPCIVDGRTMLVTRNLRLFLEQAVRNMVDQSFSRENCPWMQGSDENGHSQNRQQLSSAVFWIDAICINQQDNVEKSSQVSYMSKIYSNATKVAAWLGPGAQNSDLAFEFFNGIASVVELQTPSRAVPKPNKSLANVLRNPRLEKALSALSTRPYWTRAWVFQEIVLGSRLHTYILCGSDFLRMSSFETACRWATKQSFSFWEAFLSGTGELMLRVEDVLIALLDLPSRAYAPATKTGMTLAGQLLRAYKRGDHRATDPRDHVYSLLGIATDSSVCGISPDYELSTEACFTMTAKYFYNQTGPSGLFMSGLSDSIPFGLPSWVPDWSRTQRYPSFVPITHDTAQTRTFRCSGTSERFIYRLDKHKMRLSAITVDTITHVMQLPTIDLWHPQCLPRVFTSTQLAQITQRYRTDVHKALLCTTIADQLVSSKAGGMRLSQILGAAYSTNSGAPIGSPQLVEQHKVSRELMLDGKTMFVTRAGYLGIGTAGLKVQDTVHIVRGVDVPLVLRPGRSSEVSLVGSAYVHGVMDGELVTSGGAWRELGVV